MPPGTRVIKAEPGSKTPENAIPVEFKDVEDFATESMGGGAFDNEMKYQRTYKSQNYSTLLYGYNRLGSTAELLMGYNDEFGSIDTNAMENIDRSYVNTSHSDDYKCLMAGRNHFSPNYLTSHYVNDETYHISLGARECEDRDFDSLYETADTYKLNRGYGAGCSKSTGFDFNFKYAPYFEKYIRPSQMTPVSSVDGRTLSSGSDLYSDVQIQLHKSED